MIHTIGPLPDDGFFLHEDLILQSAAQLKGIALIAVLKERGYDGVLARVVPQPLPHEHTLFFGAFLRLSPRDLNHLLDFKISGSCSFHRDEIVISFLLQVM